MRVYFISENTGLSRTPQDHCFYFGVYQRHLFLVDVFVDDILIGCANDCITKQVKDLFCKHFEMSDVGPVNEFLGMKITQTSVAIFIDQCIYFEKILQQFLSILHHLAMKRGHNITLGEDPETERQKKFVCAAYLLQKVAPLMQQSK